MRSFQQAIFQYTEDRLTAHAHGTAQVDVRNAHTTLRVRVKPTKLFAHLDLGRYIVARPLLAAEMMVQPYLFFATNRLFDRHLYSLGGFLAIAKDLYSHLRVSVINRGAASDVFAQHNLVKAWPGLTFNHLLYFKIFSNEAQIGNTVNVLASYGRAQVRAEVSEQRQNKEGQASSEAKFSLGYFLADNCLVGVNHVRDLVGCAQFSELGVAYKPEDNTQIKAKIDCRRNLKVFAKYRWSEDLSVTIGASGSVDNRSRIGSANDLPLAFSLGLRFRH